MNETSGKVVHTRFWHFIHIKMMRCRSNHHPYPIYTTILTGKNLPVQIRYRSRVPTCVLNLLEVPPKPETPPGTTKEKLIQTIFRESEAQTDPYVVDVAEPVKKELEILTLDWLFWNNGLPAGEYEIQTIERARQKRAWTSALPLPFDETSKEIRAKIIEAVEINESKYREEMIALVGSLRMELAEKQMKEKLHETKLKSEERLMKYTQVKKDEKNKKIQNLRLNFNRQLRKLAFSRQKVNRKYHRWNIIKQFTDKTSELYAPQMRFGQDPRHWHENISTKFGYWEVFKKLDVMHQTMSDIPEPLKPAFDFNTKARPREHNHFCARAAKWTEDNLEKLNQELRNIRRRRYLGKKHCFLKNKVPAHDIESETPTVAGISDEEEDLFQACLLLQKTIKGRAIQAVMFEGRVKCQELIEELKSTHALQNHMEDIRAQTRKRVYGLQRQVEIDQMHEKRKNEILFSLEGKTTGDMLDFLAKELLRLQDERLTQASALMANQERHKREAAEAGRRQVEEQRRKHDEMFKQIMKMHQNTVHAFLEDVLTETRQWLANREAREYVTEVAKKTNNAAFDTGMVSYFNRPDDLKEEEIIADLIHNFALPEAEKRIVRKRLNDKQRNYLKTCHDEVYSNIEKIIQGARTQSGDLVPLQVVRKHKVPPFVRVKYLRLKRMHDSSSSNFDSQNSSSSILNEQFAETHITQTDVKQQQQQQQQHPSDKENWSSGFSRQKVIIENDEND